MGGVIYKLSIYHLSIIDLFIHLFIYLSVYPASQLATHLSIHHLFIYLSLEMKELKTILFWHFDIVTYSSLSTIVIQTFKNFPANIFYTVTVSSENILGLHYGMLLLPVQSLWSHHSYKSTKREHIILQSYNTCSFFPCFRQIFCPIPG